MKKSVSSGHRCQSAIQTEEDVVYSGNKVRILTLFDNPTVLGFLFQNGKPEPFS